jgi:hypothetical protein
MDVGHPDDLERARRTATHGDHGGTRGQRQHISGETDGGRAGKNQHIALERAPERGIDRAGILGGAKRQAGDTDGDTTQLANPASEGARGAGGTGNNDGHVTEGLRTTHEASCWGIDAGTFEDRKTPGIPPLPKVGVARTGANGCMRSVDSRFYDHA